MPQRFPLSGDLARGWAFAPGKTRPSGSDGAPRRSQRLHGRLAAVFFVGSGVLVLLTLPVPMRGLNVVVMASVAVVSCAVGLATWLMPWDRWPRRASLVLIPPAFALIALANAYGLANLQPYGLFFLVAFVWLGIAHPPRTSVAVAPLAALAYVLPLLHELRNPITICRGHLEVMEDGASRQEVRAVKETIINELDLMARLVADHDAGGSGRPGATRDRAPAAGP
ncbi:MAG TPA: histidine kinase dimerization/phospho-acceptor domain-containing protein [Trebonia sp.]